MLYLKGNSMKVIISGQHLSIGDSLRKYIENNVTHITAKFIEHAVSASIMLSKSHHFFNTDIIINDGTGTHTILKGSAEDVDAYKSFDLAMEKVTAQFRKHKEKMKNHHKQDARDDL